MIRTDCYLAVLEKLKAQNPQAIFEIKIEELRKLSLHKEVFVVCYEKDAKQCHRSIIAILILQCIKKVGGLPSTAPQM